jgi:hypothetical protein
MSEHQELLEDARPFCDPETGEVLRRIPEELMKKLREAKLARGIPGKPSRRTESYATWFVFLTSEIRDRVLAEWRRANAAQKRGRGKGVQGKASADAPVTGGRSKHQRSRNRGLKDFQQRRR